jgi:hypothetical protein
MLEAQEHKIFNMKIDNNFKEKIKKDFKKVEK